MLSAADEDLLFAVAGFYRKHGVEYIKERNGGWIVSLWLDGRIVRTKTMMGELPDVFVGALEQREVVREDGYGKRLLADACQQGHVTREDVEWVLGRFTERGYEG